MAYKHGVYTGKTPTSIIPPVETDAGLPVIFGTAPLHLASDPAKANRPVLCYSYAEAVAAFGYSDDWKDYTLCEAIYSQFALYNRAPVVLVNVLDPKKHKKDKENQSLTFTDGVAAIKDAVLLDTLKLKVAEAGEALGENDYTAAYDDNGVLIITALDTGKLKDVTAAFADYTYLDPSAVTSADIIGGVDNATNEKKGLETLNQVFPLTRLGHRHGSGMEP